MNNSPRAARFIALAMSLLFSCLVAEFALRGPLTRYAAWGVIDERNTVFRYDAELGWFPRENIHQVFPSGSRPITVTSNAMGFRDRPMPPVTNRPRLVFIGDSMVWGFDAEQGERFTDLLQQELPDWDVMNMGVSGYGTDQEYLLLQKRIEAVRPTVLFVMFCRNNDRADNTRNVYVGYYKPYFVRDGEKLKAMGVPVPKSFHYYAAAHPMLLKSVLARTSLRAALRLVQPTPTTQLPDLTDNLYLAIRDLATAHGASFVVGMDNPDTDFAAHLTASKVPWVDLAGADRYPENGRHWTARGHQVVADRILSFLEHQDLIKPAKNPTANSREN